MEKCLFAYNSKSGKGKLKKKEKFIVEPLSKKYDIEILHSEYAGHIGEYIQNNGEKFDTIVISGGDGTLSEAINGIMHLQKSVTLGYIPSGTVNDVANSLKISKNIKKALKIILDGNIFYHDVFKMNDRFGIYVCCTGMFCETSYATSQKSKKKVGKLAYALYGIKKIFNSESFMLTLNDKNNVISGKFALMLITNSKSVAGFKLNKDASLDDGFVDIALVKAKKQRIRFCEVLQVAKLFLFGFPKKSSKNIQILHLNKFRVEMDAKNVINLDGESVGNGSFNFEVVKKSIKIFVPKK